MWFWNASQSKKVYHCFKDDSRQEAICGEQRELLSFRLRDESVDDAQKCSICKYLQNVYFEDERKRN